MVYVGTGVSERVEGKIRVDISLWSSKDLQVWGTFRIIGILQQGELSRLKKVQTSKQSEGDEEGDSRDLSSSMFVYMY